jgi:hypothetical protein
MSLLRKPREGQSLHKFVIDFQAIEIGEKIKNIFSEGIQTLINERQKNIILYRPWVPGVR